jgi:hypothetical protein
MKAKKQEMRAKNSLLPPQWFISKSETRSDSRSEPTAAQTIDDHRPFASTNNTIPLRVIERHQDFKMAATMQFNTFGTLIM